MRLLVGALLVLSASAGCSRPATSVERALAGHSADLRPREVGGQVQLDCSHPDAEVFLDGVQQGFCSDFAPPAGLVLRDGSYRLEVRKSGFVSYRAEIFAGRARTRLMVELAPMN